MKKKLAALIASLAAVCACIFALAACGGDGFTNYPSDGHEHVYTHYEYNDDGSCVDGTETALCDKCGAESHTRVKVGSAVGHHVYSDYVCIGCGRVDPEAPDTADMLKYTPIVEDEETVAYSASYSYNSSNRLSYIIVPAEHDGKPVTEFTGGNLSYVQNITLPEGIKKIGAERKNNIYNTSLHNGGFSGGGSLRRINIPSTVNNIVSGVFVDCTNLKGIDVADDNIYYHCAGDCLIETHRGVLLAGMDSSVIPDDDSVTSIADGAFRSRYGLTSVAIPSSVTSIGKEAFRGCYRLTSVAIPSSVTSISEEAFYNCSGLTSVSVDAENENYRSYGNSIVHKDSKTLILALPDAVLPNDGGIVRIESHAFVRNVPSDYKIPDSVTSIGEYAFPYSVEYGEVYYVDKWCISACRYVNSDYDESADGTVELRDGTVGFAENCFIDNDHGYVSITLPASIKYFGIGKYEYGTRQINTQKLYYKGDLASWCGITGHEAVARTYWDIFNSTEMSCEVYVGDKKLEGDIVIPAGTTKIESYAFYDMTDITGVSIPSGITEIGDRAFEGCTGITELTVPNGVTTIGDFAFAVGVLESLTLPNSLTQVGEHAFSYAKSATLPLSAMSSLGYCPQNIVLTDGEVIPAGMFSGTAEYLRSITLPDTLKVIEYSQFYFPNLDVYYNGSLENWCAIDGLSYLMINTNLIDNGGERTLYINGKELEGELVIPDGVTEIADGAFYHCDKITSVKLPNTVAELPQYALPSGITDLTASASALKGFSYKGTVKNVTVNGGKLAADTLITAYEWTSYRSLETWTLAEGLSGIGAGAFEKLPSADTLTSLTVPQSVTEIEAGAFSGLSSLVELSTPFVGAVNASSKAAIPSSALKVLGAMFGSENYDGAVAVEQLYGQSGATGLAMTFYIPATLKKVTVDGDTLHDIEFGAFSNCTGLTDIVVGNASNIKGYAFYNCSSLQEFDVTVEVGLIDGYAFSGCTSLTRLGIADFDLDDASSPNNPANNRNAKQLMLRNGVFKDCTQLTEVTIPERVISIGGKIFDGCTSLVGVTFDDVEWLISTTDAEPSAGSDYTFSQTPADNVALINAEFVTIVNKNAYTNGSK